MLKVVNAPRVISSCFPISTISMSLVGLLSRSTMLPASRAAWVPVFMATPTSACARAGASLVPSPVMATRCPAACSSRIRFNLSSGFAWAMKSSTPASAAMAAAVRGLSPVTMTVRMPMRRSWAKRSRMPPLTTSFNSMTPRTVAPSATTSGVPPALATASTESATAFGKVPPRRSTQASMEAAAPLRMMRERPLGGLRSTPLIRVCAVNGTKVVCSAARSRPRRANCCLASTTMLRPSGVSSAREASWAASASCSAAIPGAVTNRDAMRFPSVMVPVLSSSRTSMSPAASTARPEVARTLRRMSRSMPLIPMALSSPPMVVGIRQTRSEMRTGRVRWAEPGWPAAFSL